MALVKLVVEKRNTSGTVTSITPINIINSRVIRQGNRAVDTAEFTVSIKHDVAENDTVKYIQDIVDTDFLTAIYNFQVNNMDEGGYDLDGTGTHAWKEPQDTSGNFSTLNKFSPNYSAEFDGTTGKKVTVSDDSKLDFSKQFDIIAWVTTYRLGGSTGDKRIFFSKYDSGGSGNGIEIGATKLSGGWAIYAVVRTGGTDTTFTGDLSDYYMGSTLPRLIRLRRGSDNKVHLTINGAYDGTSEQTISGSFDNTTDMVLGSNYNDSTPFNGLMHQLRIYNGITLTEDEIQIIHSSPPQPMTMKFLGRVYNIKDDMKHKKISCKGNGKLLLQTNLTKDILGSTTTGENATRTNNDTVFDAGQDIPDIIQSIIKRVDGDFEFYNNPTPNSIIGEFIAEGNFVSTVNVLALKDALTFFTLPRKVFIIENYSGASTKQIVGGTNYLFEGATIGGYDVSQSGKNDSRTVNDVEVIGRLKKLFKKENINSGSNVSASTTYPLSHNPLNLTIRKISDDSVFTDYTFNFDKKTITTTSSASSVGIYAEYWYEDISSSNALYKRHTDSSSITNNGRYSKKIYIPQFTNFTDFDTWAQTYLGTNAKISTVNERVTIKAPFLINSLRENHKIDVKNVKKFTSDTNNTKEDMIVKSIEWLYPEGMTIINCGEYDFDSFDYDKDTSESIAGLTSTLTETKTA